MSLLCSSLQGKSLLPCQDEFLPPVEFVRRACLEIALTFPGGRRVLLLQEGGEAKEKTMSSLVRNAVDAIWSYAGSTAWSPVVLVCRTGVLSLLQQITCGQLLVVEEKDGAQTLCGQSSVADLPIEPRTELRVRKDAFWVRVALFADMVSSL